VLYFVNHKGNLRLPFFVMAGKQNRTLYTSVPKPWFQRTFNYAKCFRYFHEQSKF